MEEEDPCDIDEFLTEEKANTGSAGGGGAVLSSTKKEGGSSRGFAGER
jgi:hypothetical protein